MFLVAKSIHTDSISYPKTEHLQYWRELSFTQGGKKSLSQALDCILA